MKADYGEKEGSGTHIVTEDLATTGVRSMIWNFLTKAVWKEEAELKSDKSRVVVFNV